MNLQLKSIAGKGEQTKERLVLNVLKDTDVGDYLLMRTGYDGENATTKVHTTFWFPFKKVKAGDLVVLYTKHGAESERTLQTGSKVHFFYWNQSNLMWTEQDKAAVLVHAPSWIAKGTADL